MSFSENLIELRKLNNYTQEDLAELIGVSRQTLSKYETGESLPDIEKCKQLAEVFSVTIDDLISYEKNSANNMGFGIPPKGKHIFGMVKVGEKGQIVIERTALMDEDEVMMQALDAGAEDFVSNDDAFEVYTAPNDFSAVRETLEGYGYTFLTAEVNMIPQNTTEITDAETIEKIERFLERLDDNDDVQEVYHNGSWEENE